MERWKARIVYSLLGRMAYASLYDHLEENEELAVLREREDFRTLLARLAEAEAQSAG